MSSSIVGTRGWPPALSCTPSHLGLVDLTVGTAGTKNTPI